MAELLDYLNSPNLVANFQKVFGIEANFSLQKQFLNCINQKNNAKLKSRVKTKISESNEDDDNKKNNKYYKIHNKFWFYLFHIGAAMGM